MPDKDFEQQVREGLRDWAMTPSAFVRQAVLDKVRQRRRRRAALWVPLALLFLGFSAWGGWYITRSGSGAGTRMATTAAHTPKEAIGARVPASPAAGDRSPVASATTSSVPAVSGPGVAGAPVEALTVAAEKGGSAASSAGADHSSSSTNSRSGNLTQATIENLPDNDWVNALTPASLIAPMAGQQSLEREKQTVASSMPAKDKNGRDRKWSFYLHAGAGVSAQGALMQFHTPQRSIAQPVAGSPGVTLPGGNNPGYADTLSASQGSLGLELGLGSTFRLSRRFGLGIGLTYGRWEDRLNDLWEYTPSSTGTYTYSSGGSPLVQTTVPNSIYSSRRISYTNVFQTLRVPLDLTWHITPGRCWNPSLSGGVSPTYLFGGNALMYQTYGIGYEKSSALYRHWSLAGEIGASVDLVHSKGLTLQAGPVVEYDFGNIQENAPVKDHVNYLGLRVGVVLPGHKIAKP